MSTKAQKKALDLQRTRLEVAKAQLEYDMAELDAAVVRRKFDELYSYDPKARGEFRLEAGISDASCRRLLADVERFAYLNDGAPITLYLDSPGGAVIAGLGLYDSLRAVATNGHKITTITRGYAASMGAVLLQAGDERLIGPESMFMFHEISSVAFGKLHEMENDLERTKKLNDKVFSIVASRSKKKWTGESLYTKVRAKDWWLSADEAVANCFADRIG